jgi:hypothetical protein
MDPNREKLKTINIPSLPYATKLDLSINDANGSRGVQTITVSEGKELQFDHPGTNECIFESNGSDPIMLVFKDTAGAKGVWLNGFEISEW